MPENPLAPLVAAMDDAARWLASAEVAFAVIGGVAASLRGRPRVTKDVDFVVLVEFEDVSRLLAAGPKFGIEPRAADVVEFAAITRVLLLRHKPTQIELDVSLGALPFERELVANATTLQIGQIATPVACAEDIVIMKALALRPRDISDIEGLLDVVEELDLERVRRTVEEFSKSLEAGDLLSELDRIIAKQRGAGR